MAGSVYVASSLLNATRVREVQNRFRAAGIEISYDWTSLGKITDESILAKIGEDEEQGVVTCDLLFMMHPARNGTHCELGMARVLDKHIIILEEGPEFEKKPFYYRPADSYRPIHRFKNEDEAFSLALELLKDTA